MISKEKSWNPATQRVEYIVYNELHQTDAEFVQLFVGVDQEWNLTSEHPPTNFYSAPNEIRWTVTDVCPDGLWIEFTHNTTGEIRPQGSLGFMKTWDRSH